MDVDVFDDGIVDGPPIHGGYGTGLIAFDTSAIPVRITVADGIELPIPAAVRPFAFHAQAVALSASTFGPMFGDSDYALAL